MGVGLPWKAAPASLITVLDRKIQKPEPIGSTTGSFVWVSQDPNSHSWFVFQIGANAALRKRYPYWGGIGIAHLNSRTWDPVDGPFNQGGEPMPGVPQSVLIDFGISLDSFVGTPDTNPVPTSVPVQATPSTTARLGSSLQSWISQFGPIANPASLEDGDCDYCIIGPDIGAVNGRSTQFDGVTSLEGIVVSFYVNTQPEQSEDAVMAAVDALLPGDKLLRTPPPDSTGGTCGPEITPDCFGPGGSCKIWEFDSASFGPFSVIFYSDLRTPSSRGNGSAYDPNNVTSVGVFNVTGGSC